MAESAWISAAAGAGKAGIDFVKNVIDEAKATIKIENGTEFTFTHLKTISESGKIKTQLPPKLSKGSYVMETMGKAHSLKGTNGIVTLQIDDTCFAVAIVWCVPIICGGNLLAIGVYAPCDLSDPQKIISMVRNCPGKPTAFLENASQDYKNGITNVQLDHVVKIMANMNNHKPGTVIIQISETATELREHLLRHQEWHDETDIVRKGASLRNVTVDDLFSQTKLRVVGVIEITNITSFNLTKPKIHTDGGRCSVHPQDVGPSMREAVVVHKYPRTATGSYGTLSFYIKELNCRVVLMWSLPFNLDFFSNWLALDIKSERDLDHSKLFDMMYYRKGVVRKKYDKEFSNTCLSEDAVTLTASMTPSHRSHIKFKIELDEEKLATSKF